MLWHPSSPKTNDTNSNLALQKSEQPPQPTTTSVFAQVKRAWQSILFGQDTQNSSSSSKSGSTLATTATTKRDSVDKANDNNNNRMAVNSGGSGAAEAVQPTSPVKLDVIVVGAGISGLATAISTALSGHNVTVFESAKELLEVSLFVSFSTGEIQVK